MQEGEHNTSNTNQPACLFFGGFFGLFSAESMILWLSYGSKTFHAPLSAFARTHPNEIKGNEICLDESPGLHSPCHDPGILMSCWNRYTVRTWPKRKQFSAAVRRANLPNICSQTSQQRLCRNRSCSQASGGGAVSKASIRTCVFLIGLFPNLINCENVVGGMARPSVALWRASQAPISAPESQITEWFHAFHKYSVVVILFGAPRCSDSRDLYNVSVCKKKWKQSGEKKYKND